MLNQPVTSSPVPSMLAVIRYIGNGDKLNSASHQAQAADIAQCLGHLKGSKKDAADTLVAGDDADTTYALTGTADAVVTAPNVTGNHTYTLSDPPSDGLTWVFRRLVVGSGFALALRRADTTLIGTLPNTGASAIAYKSIGGAWTAVSWSGDAANMA